MDKEMQISLPVQTSVSEMHPFLVELKELAANHTISKTYFVKGGKMENQDSGKTYSSLSFVYRGPSPHDNPQVVGITIAEEILVLAVLWRNGHRHSVNRPIDITPAELLVQLSDVLQLELPS